MKSSLILSYFPDCRLHNAEDGVKSGKPEICTEASASYSDCVCDHSVTSFQSIQCMEVFGHQLHHALSVSGNNDSTSEIRANALVIYRAGKFKCCSLRFMEWCDLSLCSAYKKRSWGHLD
jgi:hypothetical protein